MYPSVGLGRMEAFPIDVWMKRIMAELLPDGLPDFALPYAGIAQQYLFPLCKTEPHRGKKSLVFSFLCEYLPANLLKVTDNIIK